MRHFVFGSGSWTAQNKAQKPGNGVGGHIQGDDRLADRSSGPGEASLGILAVDFNPRPLGLGMQEKGERAINQTDYTV